jgi:hypothetical protein
MQPQIMSAQKSERILIFEINKDYWHVFKYQSTIFNHLSLFMLLGSSIADTQQIFFLLKSTSTLRLLLVFFFWVRQNFSSVLFLKCRLVQTYFNIIGLGLIHFACKRPHRHSTRVFFCTTSTFWKSQLRNFFNKNFFLAHLNRYNCKQNQAEVLHLLFD